MRIRTRVLKCFGCAALAGVLLAGCGEETKKADQMTSFSNNEAKTGKPQLFTVPQDQMSHVQVVTMQPASFVRTLRFSGAVAFNAFKTTAVITQVGGPVAKILVVPGAQVKQGQPLLEVSSPDYSQIRAVYLKARDAGRLADKNYERAKDLFAHEAIAERDLQQAESDRNQAHVDLESAEQSLRILGVPKPEGVETTSLTADIPLLSPIAGEVVERLVSPGQVIQAGATQAFTISDMSTVWVMANIYQDDLSVVKVSDDVSVTTDAFPDVFHGKISFIGAALDANTRTMQARIVVDNKNDKLKKDMYVTVTVTAGTVKNALTVPDAAILRDEENQPFVYLLNGSSEFGRRGVEIGSSNNGKTQINSGLAPGDKIVGDGSLFLQFANSLQR